MGIDPVSLALISTVGSAVIGGGAGLTQGMYQAEVAQQNAALAKQNAIAASARGAIEAQENDLNTKALLGEQVAAQAASGVSLSGRSQLATRNSARMLGRRDTENILTNADLERYNYQSQENQFKADAKAAKVSAGLAVAGAAMDAVGGYAQLKMPQPSLVGAATATSKNWPKPIPKPVTINPLVRSKFGGPR